MPGLEHLGNGPLYAADGRVLVEGLTATPANTDVGQGLLYFRNGRWWQKDVATAKETGAWPSARRQWAANFRGGAAPVMLGEAAGTEVGTKTNGDDAVGPGTIYTSAATSAAHAGWRSPANIRLDWYPDVTFFFKTGASIANARWWIALAAADLAGSNPNVARLALTYASDGTDGTAFWRLSARDGVGGAETREVTTAAIAANTWYVVQFVRMVNIVADMQVFVLGVPLGVMPDTWPSTATPLEAQIKVQTSEAVAKAITAARVTVAHAT